MVVDNPGSGAPGRLKTSFPPTDSLASGVKRRRPTRGGFVGTNNQKQIEYQPEQINRLIDWANAFLSEDIQRGLNYIDVAKGCKFS